MLGISRRVHFKAVEGVAVLRSTRAWGVAADRALNRHQSYYSTEKEAEKTVEKKKNDNTDQMFDPRFIGLSNDQYIPLSFKNFPNFFTSPKLSWFCLARKIYSFGINTIQIALLRYQTGIKPQFLLWKNNAIQRYVDVNKAFANKDIKPVAKSVSIWVEGALKSRVKSIPQTVTLSWKLVKFNETPKLVTFRPIMLPGRPVEYAQIVYKFSTKQELVKVNLQTEKASKLERDVVDYVGFAIDLDTNEVLLAGSLFENSPTDKIPKPGEGDNSKIFEQMKHNGDIYRPSPGQIETSKRDT